MTPLDQQRQLGNQDRTGISPRRRAVLPMASAMVAATLFIGTSWAAQDDPAASAAQPTQESDGSAAAVARPSRLDLAKAGTDYLVLDIPKRTIKLVHGAATLREFSLTDIGVARLRQTPLDPATPIVALTGLMLPERVMERKAVFIHDGTGEQEVLIPPTPEELYPAPHRFELRYQDVLRVDIRDTPLGEESSIARLWNRLSIGLQSERPAVWVQLSLSPEDLGELYRVVDSETGIVVSFEE